MTKVWFTARELAPRWKMNPTSLANWRRKGKGPQFVKDGWSVKYHKAEVEKWDKIILTKKGLPLPG